jgi:SAM-dependent methyltransferase
LETIEDLNFSTSNLNRKGISNEVIRISGVQDKRAEEIASGMILERFHAGTWEKQDPFKRDNLAVVGILEEKDKFILDFGCGPGTYGVILGRKNSVVGIDLAKEAVRQAQFRAKKERSDFQGVIMDGDFQAISPNSFDICLSAWALHHFPDLNLPMRQICNALKLGGKIIIIEPNEASVPQRISRFIEDRSRQLVLSSGLDTPNRTTHLLTEYITALQENGLEIIRSFSHYNGEKAVLPDDVLGLKRLLLNLAVSGRHILFTLSSVFGSGAELFLVARKNAG